jgi:hypothetical protein
MPYESRLGDSTVNHIGVFRAAGDGLAAARAIP